MRIKTALSLFVFLYMCSECMSAKKIPSFVNLCKRKHPEFAKCFNNTLFEMIPYMVKGIPEMGIVSIDPLHFSTIKVASPEGMTINVEIELSNGSLSGIQNMQINDLKANVDTALFSVKMLLPEIRLQGDYKATGKILLFDLDSRGSFDLNSTDLVLEIMWIGKHETKKGKQHIHFESIEFNQLKVKNVALKLEDSNKENQPFIDTIFKSVNDNLDTLEGELDGLIRGALTEVFLSYFNRVFGLFSNDQLFPED